MSDADLPRSVYSAVGPTKHPIQFVLGALFSGGKWLVCEVDHSSMSTTEVNNECRCTFITSYTFMTCTETAILF